ncbi:MAG: 16S rRNA (adenine(1518)-N(6)/adenine(1519)-N(6))-dimethyltransferase RsmA [Lautropia sp.]|nr:16S rRNA (adenine(1518)-N(6)/adenine(1519)-N(6))-dimethyltransferase RsmA [Lautropia sp.]MCL4701727.1 16S rRNA (adenine(1518)-N(6)/adenine(1519)-N(6))-dimethyltransferase RsmA [Burkholderiaceae bacterium]MDL1906639.1 16S rRNA (adenine(1518)-N(6)/adenine(1519)-N(6))-dimethyltransferase RsmA [Betaproteobacteria bacterium PRO1]RIK90915.1 MAG: 16S rRNA (adenine(1518)-N(6)/adenine(1519)-N(6))-dimethyltransferase [Burkholderiales bacterium]
MRPVAGHVARKRFGQHFLVDASVIAAIVAAIDPRDGQVIVEIGPGLAALTEALLERVPRLHAVEIDRDLAARLRRRWGPQRLELHEADALHFDFSRIAAGGDAAAPLRLVGNLPYSISSPLLVRLLAFRGRVVDQHFMLQKEVVDRIVAAPGGSGFGRLSVLLQACYEVESLFVVPPQAFDPPPAVDSAVLRMAVRSDVAEEDTSALQRLLAAGFAQRRKMIRKTLLPWLAAHGVRADGLDPAARPEDLDVATWLDLARRLRDASA